MVLTRAMAADALLAGLVPAWAVSQIFLSDDLLPWMFATLEMKDCAAASVCSAWRAAWIATEEGRRGLRHVEMPAFGYDIAEMPIASSPAGDILCHSNNDTLTVVDAACRAVFTCQGAKLPFLVSSCRLYELHQSNHIKSYAMADDLPQIAEHIDDRYDGFTSLTLAAGLLFAIGFPYEYADGAVDEIVALDAETLVVRARFGKSVFAIEANGLAVIGDELYAAEKQRGCLQVFSLAGEHLRTIARGGWRQPDELLHYDGRLYLTEYAGLDEEHDDDEEEEADWSEDRKAAGRRIFVLTPQGETLQVWKSPGGEFLGPMHLFGRKLLVQAVDALDVYALRHRIALKGL